MKAPCLGCESRTVQPNCHMTCERYLQYRASREQALRNKSEYGMVNDAIARDQYRMHIRRNANFARRRKRD